MPVFAHHSSEYIGQPYGLLVGPDLHQTTALAGQISFSSLADHPGSTDQAAYDTRTFEHGDCREVLAMSSKRQESHFDFAPLQNTGYENQPVFVAYRLLV